MDRIRRFWRGRSGASAVEFALVVPLFATLIFGMINVALALWGAAALHYTVDAAARCQAVLTETCSSSSATIAWANSHYVGPSISPTFTILKGSLCGAGAVNATATYKIHAVLVNVAVPMTATSCFPNQD